MQQTAAMLRRLLASDVGFAPRHAAEVSSVITGLRRCARVATTVGLAEIIMPILHGLGLAIGRPEVIHREIRRASADRFCERVAPPEGVKTSDHVAFIVARTQADADEGQRVDDKGDAAACGRMLTFPTCCTRAYARIERGDDWVAAIAASVREPPRRLHWSANCLAGLFTIDTLHSDFFPCRLGCPEAAAFVRTMAASARQCGLDQECDRGVAAMQGSMILMDGVVVSLRHEGSLEHVDGCEIRPPRDPRWRDVFTGEGVRFDLSDGGVIVRRGDDELLRARGSLIRFEAEEFP